MMPLFDRLDARIAGAESEAARGELLAERAGYMARVGQFEAARKIVAELRTLYGDGRYPALSILIMLAEGLIKYYSALDDSAYERFERAYALSAAFGLSVCTVRSAAWLAHLELDRSNYDAVGRLVGGHFENSKAIDWEAACRFSTVMADAHLLAGDRRSSQGWFNRAREYAALAGDRAGIGAVMYNRASFGISWARARKYLGLAELERSEAAMLRMEIASSREYQEITGVNALAHLSDIYLARAFMACGQYFEAFQLLEPLLRTLGALELRRRRTPIFSDVVICLHRLGRSKDVRGLLSEFTCDEWSNVDCDDLVVMLGDMLTVARELGDVSLGLVLEAKLRDAELRYRNEVDKLSEVLGRLESSFLVRH